MKSKLMNFLIGMCLIVSFLSRHSARRTFESEIDKAGNALIKEIKEAQTQRNAFFKSQEDTRLKLQRVQSDAHSLKEKICGRSEAIYQKYQAIPLTSGSTEGKSAEEIEAIGAAEIKNSKLRDELEPQVNNLRQACLDAEDALSKANNAVSMNMGAAGKESRENFRKIMDAINEKFNSAIESATKSTQKKSRRMRKY